MNGSENRNRRPGALRIGAWIAFVAATGVIGGCLSMQHGGGKAPLAAAPAEGTAAVSTFFGLNAITPFHAKTSPDPAVREAVWKSLKKDLATAKGLGATHVRVDMWWGVIEPEKGRFDWDFPDRVIHEIVAAGLEAYPILCYNAAWSPNASPATDDQRKEFGNYVFEMVRRYKDHVRMWEVWNEPNITPFWVPKPDSGLYAELLKVAYGKAKEADPACTVVGLCTAGADYSFLEGVYGQGGQGFFDALSFHHYDATKEESVLDGEIRQIRRILARHGDGSKPVLLTELGLSTGPSTVVKGGSENDQASWMVKKHLLALAGGVSQFYWFKMKDDPAANNPDGFWGLLRDDYSRKPSATAYRQMTERLAGATCIGKARSITELAALHGNVEFLLFRRPDEVFGCGWTRNDGKPVRILLPADKALKVEDLQGRTVATPEPAQDGYVTVEMGPEPRYVRGLPLRALPLASMHFLPDPVYLSPGESRTITLSIDNPLDTPLEVDLRDLQAPPPQGHLTITAPRPRIEVPPQSLTRVSVSISLPATAPRFRAQEYSYASSPLKYTYGLRIEYAEPFRIRMLAQGDADRGTITTILTNLTDQPVSGAVSWLLRDKEQPGSQTFTDLKPGASASLVRRLAAALNAVTLTARVKADNGMGSSKDLRLYGQALLSTPPAINGNLDEWADLVGIDLTRDSHLIRPKDKSLLKGEFKGTLKMAWTRDHLFVAADVTDPVPVVNPHRGPELWRGDSLEVYLGFGGPTLDERYGERQFQIGISPGDGGKNPSVWNWHPRAGEVPSGAQGGAPILDATVAVEKTPSGYRLEADIPLKSLGETVEAGQFIGFDAALNNKDNPASDTNDEVLIWNGDGTGWNNPSAWGVGVILAKH